MSVRFCEIPEIDFASPLALSHLIALHWREIKSRSENTTDDPVLFTAVHKQEKHYIVQSLQEKIFLIKDSLGYPIKIEIPGDRRKQHGNYHIFDCKDWKEVKHPGNLLRSTWPPTSAEKLLEADGTERCVMCEFKQHKQDDIKIWDYTHDLDAGKEIRFRSADGRKTVGRVVRNLIYERTVIATPLDSPNDEVSLDWKAIIPPLDHPAATTQGLKRPYSRPSDTPGLQFPSRSADCDCDIRAWRNCQSTWHHDFEIRRKSPTTAGVYALKYIPAGRPIGEFVGVLTPNFEFCPYKAGAQQTTPTSPKGTSKAELMQHCVAIPIGKMKQGSGENSKMATCLVDNYTYGNFTRFIQHSCHGNVARSVARCGGVRVSAFYSTRPIAEGEEITEDFGDEWLKEVGSCSCGSARCRIPGAAQVDSSPWKLSLV